jgi:5-methylcytosine-specific restriction endonuclease McrA
MSKVPRRGEVPGYDLLVRRSELVDDWPLSDMRDPRPLSESRDAPKGAHVAQWRSDVCPVDDSPEAFEQWLRWELDVLDSLEATGGSLAESAADPDARKHLFPETVRDAYLWVQTASLGDWLCCALAYSEPSQDKDCNLAEVRNRLRHILTWLKMCLSALGPIKPWSQLLLSLREREKRERRGRKLDKVTELELEIKAIQEYVEIAERRAAQPYQTPRQLAWVIATIRPIAEQNAIVLADRAALEPYQIKLREIERKQAEYRENHPFLSMFAVPFQEEEKQLRETVRKLDSLQLLAYCDIPPPPEDTKRGRPGSGKARWYQFWSHWGRFASQQGLSSRPVSYAADRVISKKDVDWLQQIDAVYGVWSPKWLRQNAERARMARDEAIPRLRKRIERIKNARGARARVRAAAAAHFDKTRELAATVKNQLRDQVATLPVCPYCGGELGVEPHADHIYPVSRGGLSTPENMVYCCAKCNGTKHDRTLREFLLSEGLVRDEVEERLHRLGKRF